MSSHIAIVCWLGVGGGRAHCSVAKKRMLDYVIFLAVIGYIMSEDGCDFVYVVCVCVRVCVCDCVHILYGRCRYNRGSV